MSRVIVVLLGGLPDRAIIEGEGAPTEVLLADEDTGCANEEDIVHYKGDSYLINSCPIQQGLGEFKGLMAAFDKKFS